MMKPIELNYHSYEFINKIRIDSPQRFGIYIDVETTGFNEQNDAILSLSMIPVFIAPDETYFGPPKTFFNDPGFPIDNSITELTGITNEMVAGKTIPFQKLSETLNNAGFIIAHFAEFDKKFILKAIKDIIPDYQSKPEWLCSCNNVEWYGLLDNTPKSKKLIDITEALGGSFDAHKSEADCEAGCFILSQKLKGKTGFQRLYEERIIENHPDIYKMELGNVHFDSSYYYKKRDFHFNYDMKTWVKEMSYDMVKHYVDKFSALGRYQKPSINVYDKDGKRLDIRALKEKSLPSPDIGS